MKKDITISHLVVNGCSFVYGDGLDSPNTQAWPKLLADKLGVPVVNLALGATSNDRIYRKTVEYFFTDTAANPFYIIGMTSSSRREEYRKTWHEYAPLNLAHPAPDTSWNNKIEKLLAEESDDVELIKRKFNLWLAIINLFKSNNINYLTMDMIPDESTAIHNLELQYPKLCEYVLKDAYHLSDYFNFTHLLPKLPCGHEAASSHIEIADYLHNNLINKYNIIIEPDHSYPHVKDFYKPYETKWASFFKRSDWII